MRVATFVLTTVIAALCGVSVEADAPPREITIDLARAEKPLDRFFDLSIGADYPGTLIRPDSQAQLKTAVDELGFRYIRFHTALSTAQQLNKLRGLTRDVPEIDRKVVVGSSGEYTLDIPMRTNDVVLVTFTPVRN